jgi:transcriptional regulator of nitric oxide reductase
MGSRIPRNARVAPDRYEAAGICQIEIMVTVDLYVMSWVFAGGAALAGAVVFGHGAASQRAMARHELGADAAARDWVIAALAGTGSADRLIRAALADADDRIAQARRATSKLDPVLELQVATAARTRTGYARSGDDALDVMRALAVAREAAALADDATAGRETLGAWLMRNGAHYLR